jgi:hypothetical protein
VLRDFRPDEEIRVSDSGAFVWCRPESARRLAVEEYFRSRDEDQIADPYLSRDPIYIRIISLTNP